MATPISASRTTTTRKISSSRRYGPREAQHALPGARRQLPLDHRTVAAQRTQRPHGLHGVHRHRHLPAGRQRALSGHCSRAMRQRLRSVLALDPQTRVAQPAQRVPFGGPVLPERGLGTAFSNSAFASAAAPRSVATRLVHSRAPRCPRDRPLRATMFTSPAARPAAASSVRAGKTQLVRPRDTGQRHQPGMIDRRCRARRSEDEPCLLAQHPQVGAEGKLRSRPSATSPVTAATLTRAGLEYQSKARASAPTPRRRRCPARRNGRSTRRPRRHRFVAVRAGRCPAARRGPQSAHRRGPPLARGR